MRYNIQSAYSSEGGIFTGWGSLRKGGSFQPIGILAVVGMAAGWGIPFYFAMKITISRSEKNADKALEKAENDDALK